MENQNPPSDSDERAAAEAEAYAEPQAQKLEITIKEAEVLKICPQPGDVLFFKFKGDHFYADDVNVLGKQLRALFPANKVVVMALPDNHDIELTTVKNQDKVIESDCSKPASYCADCSCGKKERIEGEG